MMNDKGLLMGILLFTLGAFINYHSSFIQDFIRCQ